MVWIVEGLNIGKYAGLLNRWQLALRGPGGGVNGPSSEHALFLDTRPNVVSNTPMAVV